MSDLEPELKLLPSLHGYDVVLASNSPRRRELLSLLGIKFRVAVPTDVDESYPADYPPQHVPLWLAHVKAQAYIEQLWEPGQLVITADTVVIVDNEILGKPKDEADARRMLRMLSGRTHKVVSGVAVTDGRFTRGKSVTTEVTFARLSNKVINHYISTCKPFDKAGAYGIQEWIGAVGVSRIEGSFYNVMGLPLHVLYKLLCDSDL